MLFNGVSFLIFRTFHYGVSGFVRQEKLSVTKFLDEFEFFSIFLAIPMGSAIPHAYLAYDYIANLKRLAALSTIFN